MPRKTRTAKKKKAVSDKLYGAVHGADSADTVVRVTPHFDVI